MSLYRIALGQQVDLYDVRNVDSGLGATLEKLAAAVTAAQQQGHPGAVVVDGVPIEDLCLSFVLPGCLCTTYCSIVLLSDMQRLWTDGTAIPLLYPVLQTTWIYNFSCQLVCVRFAKDPHFCMRRNT